MTKETAEKQGEYYEIKSGGIGRVTYPDKIMTGGVLTCHAIGILDTNRKIGYLGHFSNFATTGDALLKKVLSETKNPADLKVVVAGNIPMSKKDHKLYKVKEDYDAVLEKYRAHGIWIMDMIRANGISEENIENHLVNDPRQDSFEVEIDTETCEIAVRDEHFECDDDGDFLLG